MLVLPLSANDDCSIYALAEPSAVVADGRLSEISGVIASRRQPGILWVHNDSGDGPLLYALDRTGEVLASVELVGVSAVDWEDIALGPDGSIYVGDIGDNLRQRESIRIHRVREPDLTGHNAGSMLASSDVETVEAFYPDGSQDAEALLIDPTTGTLYVVSKEWTRARLYRILWNPGSRIEMELVAEVPNGLITGGDIRADGRQVVLRDYWTAHLWFLDLKSSLKSLTRPADCTVSLAREMQGEAIAYDVAGEGLITISEGMGTAIRRWEIRGQP